MHVQDLWCSSRTRSNIAGMEHGVDIIMPGMGLSFRSSTPPSRPCVEGAQEVSHASRLVPVLPCASGTEYSTFFDEEGVVLSRKGGASSGRVLIRSLADGEGWHWGGGRGVAFYCQVDCGTRGACRDPRVRDRGRTVCARLGHDGRKAEPEVLGRGQASAILGAGQGYLLVARLIPGGTGGLCTMTAKMRSLTKSFADSALCLPSLTPLLPNGGR